MSIISDACTVNVTNDASRIAIDDPRVTLLIVASLTDDSKGIIYIVICLLYKTLRLCDLQMGPIS
jgi:hypothetical protein